jgi:hypothetical protein
MHHSHRVLPLLESIGHTFTIESGSLVTVKRSTFYGRYSETVWKDMPTISLDKYYRAHSERSKLLARDFWQHAAIEGLRDRVDELERWRRDRDRENTQAP